MQIASSGIAWVSGRRLGMMGLARLIGGLLVLVGFLLPWYTIELGLATAPVPVATFYMSGWEVALHLGQGALWTAPLGALALLGLALLGKIEGFSRSGVNLLALLLGSASLLVVVLALGSHSVPVPGANPMFGVGERPSFGLYLTLLGLLVGALSGLLGLFKSRMNGNRSEGIEEVE